MLIPNRSVRLFKSAAGQLFAVLLVGTLFASALHAQDSGLGVTASITISPTLVNGKPALTGSYQINCSKQDDQTKYGFGEMKLFYVLGEKNGGYFASEVPGLSGLYANGGETKAPKGPLEVTGPLGGSRVRAKLSGAYCHHDQQNSELIDVWSEPVTIPPQISVNYAFAPDNPNAAPYVSSPIPITDVPNVRAGKKLVLHLNLNGYPQGTEFLELHYIGTDVNLIQVLHDVGKDFNPMKNIVTPTVAGTDIKIWAVFQPYYIISNVLQVHVVDDPDKSKAADNSDKPAAVNNPNKSKIVGNQNKPGAKKPTPIKKTKH